MDFTFVFYQALLLTFFVVVFLLVAWPGARRPGVLVGILGSVLVANALWLFLPSVPEPLGRLGRWLISAWIAGLMAATLLVVPWMLAVITRRFRGYRMCLTNPMAFSYLACS